VPRATVFGVDHPCGPRTDKRSALLFCAAGSSQLMKTRPSGPTARFGSPLPGAAGDLTSATDGGAGRGVAKSNAGTAKETRTSAGFFVMANECIALTSLQQGPYEV